MSEETKKNLTEYVSEDVDENADENADKNADKNAEVSELTAEEAVTREASEEEAAAEPDATTYDSEDPESDEDAYYDDDSEEDEDEYYEEDPEEEAYYDADSEEDDDAYYDDESEEDDDAYYDDDTEEEAYYDDPEEDDDTYYDDSEADDTYYDDDFEEDDLTIPQSVEDVSTPAEPVGEASDAAGPAMPESEASDAAGPAMPESEASDAAVSTESAGESSAVSASAVSTESAGEASRAAAQDSSSGRPGKRRRKKTSDNEPVKKKKKRKKKKSSKASKSADAAESNGTSASKWRPGSMTPAERAAIRSREYDPEENERAKQRFLKIPARMLTYGIIIAVVLIAVVVLTRTISHWQYDSYRIVSSRKQEDTLSADYHAVNGMILRCSSDGASLSNRSGEILWDTSYTMTDPAVTTCDDIMAIYDKSGTSIVVCDRSGQIGSISTSLPIVKAKVSESGNVAVIQEDANTAWIEYYAKNGTEIAAIKTSMNDPGYPMDVSVSRNGELIAVSYLSLSEGVQKAVVHIYSFGSSGQNQMDNRIADFEYNSILVPQLDYLTGSALLAFREDGFMLYSGSKTPEENKIVTVDGSIRSVFHDEEHIGLILDNADGSGYRLQIYDTSGRQQLDKEFNFIYQRVDFVENEVTLYNGSDFCVFDLSGNVKFNGTYTSSMEEIFALGKHRYVVVKETSLDMIQLS